MSLKRWFKEKWTAQDGSECGDYQGKGRVKCRPSKVVSKKKTPETWGEMSKGEKKKAVSQKQKAHKKGQMWSTHHDGGKTWGGEGKVKYEASIKEQGGQRKTAENKPTDPALYNRIKSQVKAKEKVYPSAYANGRIVKMYKARGGGFKKAMIESFSDEYAKIASSEPSMTAEDKNPAGGLSAKGRKKLRAAGQDVKPGVKGKVDTPEKAKRKGSFLRRHYGRDNPHPVKDDKGRPTRYALQAQAWGEAVPQNEGDVRALAAKGDRLLNKVKED